MSSAQSDRTVHAVYENMEIVRYDRAGKWFLEPTQPMLSCQAVSVREAARAALWGKENANGRIFLGKPGGSTFDRIVSGRA